MKVGRLKAILAELDDDTLVVLSRDPEGNGFAKLADDGISTNMVFDKKWREIRYAELTDALREQGYREEDVGPGEPCVVLWP